MRLNRQIGRRSLTPILALLALAGDLRAEVNAVPRAAEFAAGDYTLFVEATRRVRKRKFTTGNLTLRPATVDIGDGISHPYYGWTDVDFRNLGAAMGANDVSPESQDPENP